MILYAASKKKKTCSHHLRAIHTIKCQGRFISPAVWSTANSQRSSARWAHHQRVDVMGAWPRARLQKLCLAQQLQRGWLPARSTEGASEKHTETSSRSIIMPLSVRKRPGQPECATQRQSHCCSVWKGLQPLTEEAGALKRMEYFWEANKQTETDAHFRKDLCLTMDAVRRKFSIEEAWFLLSLCVHQSLVLWMFSAGQACVSLS